MLTRYVYGASTRVGSTRLRAFPTFVSRHIAQPARLSSSARAEQAGSNEANHNDSESTQSLAKAAKEGRTLDAMHEGHAERNKRTNFDLNSIFLLSIPITTQRSFIYCHHNAGLLSKDQLDNVSWLMKLEKKLVGLAVKAWGKLVSSDLTINKKIVDLVLKLLNSIPYDENCLRSFPSKDAMVRETNELLAHGLPRAILKAEIEERNVALEHLKPIPVYHARIQDPCMLVTQMHQFRTGLVSRHRKWAAICAIGIPVSLPVALIPLAPNVPGFYLAYRLYCHLQALRGAKNLGFLLGNSVPGTDGKISTAASSTHLLFQHHADLDPLFASHSVDFQGPEQVVLDSDMVDKIVDTTGLVQIKEDLYRAFKQETRRLEKERKKQSG